MPAQLPVVFHSTANVGEFTAAAAERGGLHRFVSAQDRASARRHVAPGDGARALAARALARLLGARVLGRPPLDASTLPAAIAACRSCGGPHGKPGLGGVSVNWSRSGSWVMAAAAVPAAGEVGVDLERIPDRLFDGFDAHCLSAAERDMLGPSDIGGRMGLWVAKEALLKCSGYGLSIPPAAVKTTGAPRVEIGSAPGADPHALDGWSVRGVPAPEGYAAALACRPRLPVEPLAADRLFAG